MAGAFDIGVSALLASQRQLSTTSHNIANVNTAGYTRQQVELVQRPPQYIGDGFIGKGVDISTISRTANDFLTTQVRNSTAGEAKAVTYSDLANQVNALVGDGTFGPALNTFFQSLHDANNDPSSVPARQVFLTTAQALTQRVQDIDRRFDALTTNVNTALKQSVTQLNTYATAMAHLNGDIVQAYGVAQGQAPNDLLDQRDKLLKDMSKLVNISTLEQPDHSLNVFMGHGQTLVSGSNSVQLVATPNLLDGARTEISITTGGTTNIVSDSITSGSIAGALQFRDEILNPSRNAMGRLAAGLSFTINGQHHAGLDLHGALGGDLFTLGNPVVNASPSNVGTIGMALDPASSSQLSDSDYRLRHDGSNFILERMTDGTNQTLSGAGPFTVDGMTITVTSAPAAGDEYLLQPTRFVGRGFGVAISDPGKIALASPVKSSAVLNNVSNTKISSPQVIDPTAPNLLVPTTLVFNSPPTTFQINGAGPLIPYSSGSDINVNGWRVQLTGTPAAGDTFRVDPNSNGRGDNTNGLALADLRTSKPLLGATATYQDTYSQLVSQVGSRAQQAQISGDSLKVQRENAEAARDSVAGVNLDEEAANLIRFQQAFEAAAQVIQITNQTFNSLLQATR